MPRLTENVLIGGRVYLAGEDISDADAKGVRPEVFAPGKPAPKEKAPAAPQKGTSTK